MAALMKRYGGHPYERGDMLDFKTVDPDKPFDENLRALGYNYKELVGLPYTLILFIHIDILYTYPIPYT